MSSIKDVFVCMTCLFACVSHVDHFQMNRVYWKNTERVCHNTLLTLPFYVAPIQWTPTNHISVALKKVHNKFDHFFLCELVFFLVQRDSGNTINWDKHGSPLSQAFISHLLFSIHEENRRLSTRRISQEAASVRKTVTRNRQKIYEMSRK